MPGDATVRAQRQGAAAAPVPPRIPPKEEELSQFSLRWAFILFVVAGLTSAPLAEFVLDERFGLHTQGAAQELAMASLVGIVLFAVIAAGTGLRSFGLLIAGLVVTDVAAFVGWVALFALAAA